METFRRESFKAGDVCQVCFFVSCLSAEAVEVRSCRHEESFHAIWYVREGKAHAKGISRVCMTDRIVLLFILSVSSLVILFIFHFCGLDQTKIGISCRPCTGSSMLF